MRCNKCDGRMVIAYNAPYGIREMEIAGTRRWFCPACQNEQPYVKEEVETVESLRAKLEKSEKKVKIMYESLQRLSCLGNGDRPGNSIGNTIAQETLTHIDDIK